MNTSGTVFLFPGQGSQFAGMGRDLAERFAEARAVFDEADRVLGFPLSELCFNGPEDQLKRTENTQPAILTCSVAAFRVLEARAAAPANQRWGAGRQPASALRWFWPAAVAGHSLGEYSALVAAGAIAFADAVEAVRRRGRYMQEAVPAGTGAMAAITRTPLEVVEAACRDAAQGEVVSPANINSPEQIVISGHAAAVARAAELARQRGARRAVLLPVSAPFHCALMMPAQQRLAADLEKIEFRDLRFPLVNNVAAREIRTGAEARAGLVQQVSAPVQWEKSMRALIAAGATRFVEVGPGKVLSGLLRQIDPSVTCFQAQDAAGVEAVVAALSGAAALEHAPEQAAPEQAPAAKEGAR